MDRNFGLLGFCCAALTGFAQTTESPSVVPSGEFWIESDLASWTRIDQDNRQFDAGATLFTYGVSAAWDVQFEWAGWTESTARAENGAREIVSGWGDVGLRSKWNFAGDESTGPAWAVLPYLKVPTANRDIGNGKFESGLALVYGQPIGATMWMEAMLALDWLSNGSGDRSAAWFGATVWGHESGWYGEILLDYQPETHTGALPVTAGVGFTRELRDGLSVDFELLTGLSPTSNDLTGVVRFTWVLGNTREVTRPCLPSRSGLRN
jgi:hypothetical protein